MNPIMTIAAAALLGATACSREAAGNSAAPPEVGMDTAAVASSAEVLSALSDAAAFTAAADCHARLRAMSRILSALASTKSGSEEAELGRLALARESASIAYQAAAGRIAARTGRSIQELEEALRDAEEAVTREYESRPFEVFVIWVRGEAERCRRRAA